MKTQEEYSVFKTKAQLRGGNRKAGVLVVEVRYEPSGALVTRTDIALTRESIQDLREQCDRWLAR